jgi:hypothetical protein
MDTPINGQGVRLVKQAEGEQVSLLMPWEVEGEKELLTDTDLLLEVNTLEEIMKTMYEHTKICTNPECQKEEIFNDLMDLRRDHFFPLLKDGHYALYETINALLAVYIFSKGDEPLFVKTTLIGLQMSMKLIDKLR